MGERHRHRTATILISHHRPCKGKEMRLILLLILGVCSTFRTATAKGKIEIAQRCLPLTTEAATTKRYLYIGEQTMDIRLEITDRITHQLVSHVLKILLQEVVGYVNVSLIHVHDYMNASEVLNRVAAGSDRIQTVDSDDVDIDDVPKTMISLEVWMGPGFSTESWTSTKRLEHCGPLGPVGRFGWFIPRTAALGGKGSECRLIVGHWKALLEDEVARFLDLSEDINQIKEMTKIHATKSHYCNSSDCENGIYYPPICKHANASCATLLAKHPAVSKVFISHLIELLQLKVKVAWIGAHLDDYVYNRTIQNKPVMFFSWKPSQLTSNNMFTNIAFPPCEDLEYGTQFPKNCGFEINQLNKVAWTGFQKTSPEILHVVRAMTLSQTQYQGLLDDYIKNSSSANDIACQWVRNNRQTWGQWMPANLSNKMPLYIGGIFPLTGFNYRSEGIFPAVQMAVEAINRNNSLLSDFELNLLVENGQCSTDHVMKAFIKYVSMKQFSKLIGILGPACSDTVEPLAGVAKHYHSIIISYSAEGSIFYNKNFPYFFRTIPSNMQFKYVYLHLFQKMGWTRVATLTEEGMKYPEYLSLTQDFLQSHGINFVVNRKVPKDRTHNNMTQYLEDLKEKNVRIIIGDFYDDVARAVVCEAYRQKMTAHEGYVWFFPRWFSRGWFNIEEHPNMYSSTSSSSQDVNSISCSKEQMMKAVNGYMTFSYTYYDDDDKMMQEDMRIGDWKKKYSDRLKKEGNYSQDDYAGYAYDAAWVYALAVDKLLKYNHSYIATLHTQKTANKLVEILNETDFQGVSGRLQFVGPSRISIIYILQFVNNEQRRVGRYIPQPAGGGVLELNNSNIVWMTPDKKVPGDGRDDSSSCALESFRKALDVDCEVAIVIVNILGFGLFALLMLSCFIFIKHRYEKRVKLTELRMQELGLSPDTNALTLDQWEIQREFVVINRKIGEGAFGTVYGGEVFFDCKGWVPVAVKTLKIGSAVEEKLDFLSEAEMMKRFDHPNIVALLGVCTRGEPVYTIMEFMLYGDLKTYLLARRHMVSDKNADNRDEVSDKRLTSMAMDVARGLSYLAEMKYVHRDIACRNCLVNCNRMVKIGDFGMTRPMYDSDYYQIGYRKAMLPVRWMAPESLLDGISTPMSDVWSYGVLVYEITTFGSFPFQGLSNNQVLDYVTKGQTLSVPRGCKPDMEQLLKRCWSKDPYVRPTASEIVEILANNPRLLSACLDVPLASVEIEGTGSLELQLNRRFSLSHKNHPQPHPRRRAETLDSPENIPLFKPNHYHVTNGPVSENSKPAVVTNNQSNHANKSSIHQTINQPGYRGRYATLQYKTPAEYCKAPGSDAKNKITSL